MTRPLSPKLRTVIRPVLGYVAAAALSMYAAFFLLKLWRADMHTPFEYRGDALFHGYLVKAVVDHGWYLTNPNVGAPGGLELHDFPVLDNLHLLIIKLLSAFSGNWALLFNLYYLLGFPLITLSAVAAFRQFRVAWGPAIVGSVLYAFLPSRLIKGQGHLFLDVFFQVPLAMVVALWVAGDDPPLTRDQAGSRNPRPDLRRPRSWVALIICLASASLSAYYSFFTAALLVAGGAWASVERRSLRNVVAGVALAGTIVAGLAANNLPTVVYHMRHGPNPGVGLRGSGESEIYGMKIAQVVLPVEGHRVHKLARLRQRYELASPLGTENRQASLGVVGALGFLALLGLLFCPPRPGRPRAELLRPLSVLNAAGFLFATLGGFGSLFALIVSPQIRTYTRMNVLLGFLALFAVVLILERIQQRWPNLGRALLPVVLAIGLLDQTTADQVRPYAETKALYESDADFVRRIEAAVPPGSLILELPYVPFPESPAVGRMSSYDHIAPYLHSRTLRWTFPAMRGRRGDAWLHELSSDPPPAMIAGLRLAGGAGILIDRIGYADDGREIEATLRTELNAEPIASGDGRRLFFKLPNSGAP